MVPETRPSYLDLILEVLRGNEYTKKSDIYSLGVIINEIISISPPFYNQPHDLNLALDICRGLRPKIREKTPQPLKELIQKCSDANPNNRPTSEQVLEEIKNMNINESELSYDLDSISIANSTSKTITHPQAIYTSKLLNLPSVNCLNQDLRQVQTGKLKIKLIIFLIAVKFDMLGCPSH